MRCYELVLEFARARDAGEPFEFRFEAQDYQLRLEGGVFESAPFPWNSQVMADLAELEKEVPDSNAVQRLGNLLRGFLGRLDWGRHEAAIEQALAHGREVLLTVRSAAAELYALPWELLTLKGTGQHLGELPGCAIRYEWPRQQAPSKRPPATEGGRLLFAWSNAGGLVPADAHQRALARACASGYLDFDTRRDVLGGVSLRGLSEALAAGGGSITVLHLLCHGSRSPAGTVGLWWNGSREGDEPQLVEGALLRQVLAPHTASLRLVVLSACMSGNAGAPGNHLGSVAQELHRVGVPVVVASRLPLSVPGSLVLTEALYSGLLESSFSMERALGEARRRLVLERRHLDWASLQLYAHAGDGPDIRPVAIRPYRGLLPFEARHQRFFFGREALSQRLLQQVQRAAQGQVPRFQVVAGASGAGKSSVVMAGLVPRLPAKEWDVLVVRPGELVRGSTSREDPSAALAGLLRQLRALRGAEELPSSAGATSEQVLEEAGRLREARPGRKLLLVMDQMEEVFTQLGGVEACTTLMRTLWRLSNSPEFGGVLLGTMRVDHFERCGEVVLEKDKRLDAVVYDEAHHVFVAHLAAEEVAATIEEPARLVGLEPEEGLVDKLCEDVGHEPGALPLLEYTLDLLWQRREGGWLTHAAYAEMGGVAGALTHTADQLYEALSEAQQRQARRLLVRLVDFRDAASPQTRRRAWVEEVRPEQAEARDAFDAVLERLVGSRLLVKDGENRPCARDGTWVQFAHEELIRRWERLQKWMKEDWEREQQLREVEEWALKWESNHAGEDKGASYLLTGDRLGYAHRVQQKYRGELSARSRCLIARSNDAANRARRRMKQGVSVLATLLVLALVSTALAFWLRQEELEQKTAALHSARTAQVERLRLRDPTLAALVLREVARPEASPEWRQDVVDLLQLPMTTAVLEGHSGYVKEASFSPDGTWVVTASGDGTARVWRADGSDKDHPLVLSGHAGPVSSAAFSPNGAWVVTASGDGTARVWRADGSDKDHPLVLSGHAGPVSSAAFSPNGAWVVTASGDGTARVWRADGSDKDHPLVLSGHAGPVSSAAFSPDGTRVVTASSDGTTRVWRADGSDKDHPLVISGHESLVSSAAFSPDGAWVVTASEDGTARVWRVDGSDKDHPLELSGDVDEVSSAAFSPDGTRVVTASSDGTTRVWHADGSDKDRPLVLSGHAGPVSSAAFSPDGTRVVTASGDGTARVWRADGSDKDHPLVLSGHAGRVSSAAFSPDGTRVVTASGDGTARVWRADGSYKNHPLVLSGHEGPVSSAAFSPDGTRVVTASGDKTVRVWRADGSDKDHPLVLSDYEGPVSSAAFSPDGAWVVTASGEETAVWRADGSDREHPLVLSGHESLVSSAAFSPDGTRVVTASGDGTARIWRADGSDKDHPLVLSGHAGPVSSAAFSPDGTRVVTASGDGTARVWRADGSDRDHPLVLSGDADEVFSAAFSPDGTRVVTASSDGTTRVWRADGSDREHPLVLSGHESLVSSAAFSPDGTRVVTASGDGTARVWRADGSDKDHPLVLSGHAGRVSSAAFSPDGTRLVLSGHEGRVFGHESRVFSAAFSPDGTRVVTASGDGTARIWMIETKGLQELLNAATRVCLSVKQRQDLLTETPTEAQAGLKRCERSHGNPSVTAISSARRGASPSHP
ncbi:CHAT domain-containing protein [Cystobacter fuscus]|uniref:nSTAND1 domain-containing NTPase n=1 Tax=Cystobacter fuscus TaxID=43 RepID=UPI0037C0D8B5